ncbi:hypothetical protein OOZ19_03430 [Saccharopolyspora sp. NFXS83]|uniref:hypothetical protein n=1 Tax=Saccharopolyspora sp. NFXS83 TaxID=2993560 RepID=UPI00224A6DF8|nr:hypothetical protein [Saccharopolyspora sp. NFXS83]MCX2729279.1 hypothetical protein [Saccharopolyspora sp. NFXS83]
MSIDLYLKKSPVSTLADPAGAAFAYYTPRTSDQDVEVPGQSAAVDDTAKA